MTYETPTALLLLDIENVPANAHALSSVGLPSLPEQIALDVYIAGGSNRITDPAATIRKFRDELLSIDPGRDILRVRCECSPSVKNGADMLLAAQIPLALAKPYPPITVALASNDKALIEVCAALAGNRFLSLRHHPSSPIPDQAEPDGSALTELKPEPESPCSDLSRAISSHAQTVLSALTAMRPGDHAPIKSSGFGRRIDGLLSNSHRALLAQKFAPYIDTGGEISVKPTLAAFGASISVLRSLSPDWGAGSANDPLTIAIGITMLLGLGRDAHVECRAVNGISAWHVRLVRPKLVHHVPNSCNPKVKSTNNLQSEGLTLSALAELIADRLELLPLGSRARYTPDADVLAIGVAELSPSTVEYLHSMALGYLGSGTLPSMLGNKHYGAAASPIRDVLPNLKPASQGEESRSPSAVSGSIAALWLSLGYTLSVGTHRQGDSIRYQITIEKSCIDFPLGDTG